MRKLIGLALLALAGCSTQPIALRDSQTRQLVECRADPWTVLDVQAWNEECAKRYERNGFERIK